MVTSDVCFRRGMRGALCDPRRGRIMFFRRKRDNFYDGRSYGRAQRFSTATNAITNPAGCSLATEVRALESTSHSCQSVALIASEHPLTLIFRRSDNFRMVHRARIFPARYRADERREAVSGPTSERVKTRAAHIPGARDRSRGVLRASSAHPV